MKLLNSGTSLRVEKAADVSCINGETNYCKSQLNTFFSFSTVLSENLRLMNSLPTWRACPQ